MTCLFLIHHLTLWQRFAEFLVIETVRNLTSAAFAGVICVDGFLAEQLLHLLERGFLLAAQKQQRIAVSGDGIGVVLVDGLELRLRLQNDTGGDLTAADSGDELFKIRNLSDIGKLIDQAADMHRQPAAIFVICLFAEQVEQLAIGQTDEKVEAGIRVRHDQKQRGSLVSDGIKRQLVIGSDLPQLPDVKDGKARAAAHQNGFCRFARNELSRTFYQKNKQQYYLLHYACCVCHLAV